GPGGLTRALLRAGAEVTAIEMDRRCLPALAEVEAAFPGKLKVIEGDAMKIAPATLFDGPYHIVANLPYNVGTALFTGWLSGEEWPPQWRSLTLMFQEEVARRIVAETNTSAYGRLAVLAQWRAKAKLALKVHRSAFTPPPKVMSAIVHVVPGEAPEGVSMRLLERVTEAAFGQRRKMLRQSLKGVPGALAARSEAMGTAFVGSLTMGSGQFCTNPGLVIAMEGPDLDAFVAAAATALTGNQPQVMLTPGIHDAYEKGVAALAGADGVTVVARGAEAEGCNRGQHAFFSADAATFRDNPALAHEVFGSSSILLKCKSLDEVKETIASLEGQLTATLQMEDSDADAAAMLLPALSRKVGRVLTNGWPTGVEVTHAMVHGGPFPSTSDGRTTSVGTLAMMRFLRPVCYQDVPDALLPPALQTANPWGLTRRVEGKLEVAA
ncbi:rRNA adenine N-6-methyltransferase family protein, partial [uncultured Sphingobium sp.]|uniref:rRNA adenine N-6-methyltransferase family protein n=1 Tax=uncultured Sphingobium sp. TaxID=316087 RepID=UPI00261ACBD0